MAEMQKIDTTKYIKDGKVDIDGNIWAVSLPGAAKELKFSKVQRRVEFLTKKVEKGTATEEDLDKLDSLEDFVLEYFKSVFKDDTKDNATVSKWVDETPTAIIAKAFEDIQAAAGEANVNG